MSDTELFVTPGGLKLWVHLKDQCIGKHCPVHRPSPESEAIGPLHWRYDRGIFERICKHGVGHPDPDSFDYFEAVDRLYEGVHGCCHEGCCRASASANS